MNPRRLRFFAKATVKTCPLSTEAKTRKPGKNALMRFLHDDSGDVKARRCTHVQGYRLSTAADINSIGFEVALVEVSTH